MISSIAASYGANHSIPVFPVLLVDRRQDGGRVTKRPLTERGFKDAVTDPLDIMEMFLPYEGRFEGIRKLGIGVVPGPAGYAVYDVDTKDGATGMEDLQDLISEHGDFTEGAPRVLTPSGGLHIWFKKRPGQVLGNGHITPGIEIRADNGYVLLPGGEGLYEWELGWDGEWCHECHGGEHPIL